MVPSQIICVRHGQSTLNALYEERVSDPLFKRFKELYDINPFSSECKKEAVKVFNKHKHRIGDHKSPLTLKGREQARVTGQELKQQIEIPNAVYISPYKRCQETFKFMCDSWPELAVLPRIFPNDNSLRELEFGEAFLYGNWDLYFALNHIQKELHDLAGHFWYRWPGGESVADMQQRLCIWYDRMVANYAEKRIMVVSHFGTILGLRSNIEEWDSETYNKEHNNAELINCAVTEYKALYSPDSIPERRLVLQRFNERLYPKELCS